jgi:hypothetical protein
MSQQLEPYCKYRLFPSYEIKRSQYINIQKEFKLWYNCTFRHHAQCQQYLKYDEIDSSLCSCSHRPYKCSSNQWAISKALAYTFDEQLNCHLHDIHRYLAVTKLAHVIRQEWTSQQLKNYKKKTYMNQQANLNLI